MSVAGVLLNLGYVIDNNMKSNFSITFVLFLICTLNAHPNFVFPAKAEIHHLSLEFTSQVMDRAFAGVMRVWEVGVGEVAAVTPLQWERIRSLSL